LDALLEKGNAMATALAPSPSLTLSRRLAQTPFTPRLEACGVRSYTIYNRTLLATCFHSPEEDYRHLKTHVQLWDVSCERQVELKGPDAARLAQLMTPRDLSKARIGQCLYAPLVDEDGGMLNDPVILKLGEDRYWISIADSDVLLWAKGLALGMGLKVQVTQPEVWPLAVQGPKAEELMSRVFSEAVLSIGFFRCQHLAFRGHKLAVARSGFSKQGGFEIFIDSKHLCLELWDALWQAGEALEVRSGCPNQIERIEGGLLSYGNDMTRANTPLECGLGRYCHLDRPIDFIGREALLRARDAGLKRQVRGLTVAGDPLPRCSQPWPVLAGCEEVGAVTSACNSPDLGCGIAIAMLDRDHWDVGNEVTLETPAGSCQGRVVELPFL